MLRSLVLRDFVLVERLDLEFPPGFTVLTGETGAGKSILVDALDLALGARGDGGMVRQGAGKAEIAAEFSVAALPQLQAWLRASELAGEDESACLMRRILHADGHSRAFINGLPATMQQLREAGDFLLDIYSQHAHHSLLKTATQRALLDDFGGTTELAEQVAAAYKNWRALLEQRLDMERNLAAHAEVLALLRDEVRELKQLGAEPGEWDLLQQEHQRLAHAASLLQGAGACCELLSEGEFAVTRQLHAARQHLHAMVEHDPSLCEILDGLDAAAIQTEEAGRSLKKYLDHAELDPERMNEVDDRIQAMHGAARKYRVRPEALAALLEQQSERLSALEGAGEDGALARREAEAQQAYRRVAQALGSKRQDAATKLGAQVSALMQRLALAGGVFDVALPAQKEGGAHGLEQVEFLVAGHAGAPLRPLGKVASGGELSRISLAIRVATAKQGATPVMIFDEVDVGIGGGVAEVVGQLLRELGISRQVLVVTHLPQVAALGASHLRVRKSAGNGTVSCDVVWLDAGARVEEVARMLGGVDLTDTTRRHAAEMLGQD